MIMINDMNDDKDKGKSVCSGVDGSIDGLLHDGRFSVNQWRMDIVAGDVLPS